MDINNVTLVGRLADNVKFSAARGNTAARSTGRLIVNRPPNKEGKQNYDTISVVGWGVHADNLARYTSKGKEISIVGELRSNNVKNSDGSWNNFTEVMIKEMSFGRDSAAMRAAKPTEAAPNFSQEALTKMLENNPELIKKLSTLKQGVRPEEVLAPESREKVIESPHLDISDDVSDVAENPFNE